MLCPLPSLCFSSLRSCLPSCLSAGVGCCVRLPACVSLVPGLVSDLVSQLVWDAVTAWSGILSPPHRACFSPTVCCLRWWNFCNRSGVAVLLKIFEYVMFQPAKTEVFAEIDEDGSGTIDRHEQLGQVRKSHGFVTSQPLKVRLSGCSPIRFVLLLSGFGTPNKFVFCRDSTPSSMLAEGVQNQSGPAADRAELGACIKSGGRLVCKCPVGGLTHGWTQKRLRQHVSWNILLS